MNIAHNVEHSRNLFPDKPALIFEDQLLTYRALDAQASCVAKGLRSLGIGVGDRVALFLPNSPAFVVAYLGIQKIGAIAVSLNARLKAAEVEFILADSGATALITTAALRGNVPAQALPDLNHILITAGPAEGDSSFDEWLLAPADQVEAVAMAAEAPAAIVYTSGTTGFPKGATLSHGNVISNMAAKKRYLDIRPDDRLLLFLPLSHCFGQNAILNSGLSASATIVLQPQADPEQILKAVVEAEVTMFFGVPATFILLYDRASPQTMRSVRYYFSAAANLPREIEKKWQAKFGIVINQGYGLTETSPFASYNHHLHYKPGSIGTPIEHVAMKVVDVESGQELGPGELGEIVIRGPNVMLGYWRRPAETAQAIKEGWFHSGDIGRMDEEGYFYIEDRLKDMINAGGLKVYPAEVENILYQHPAVAEAAVYGLADPLLGERVKAQIVLKPDQTATEPEIIAFCRQHLADFKSPRQVEFVASLPKSPTGKILKRVLRQEDASLLETKPAEVAPTVSVPTASAIQNWIVAWLVDHLGADRKSIDLDKSFLTYGLDSALAVQLANDLGDWLEREVEVIATWNFPTIAALAHYLAAELKTANGPGQTDLARPSPERTAAAAESLNLEAKLKTLSEAELAKLLTEELTSLKQEKAD